MESIRSMLSGGKRWSLGRAGEVLEVVRRRPGRLTEVMECLWDEDAIVTMRASDVAEKISAANPAAIAPFKAMLLALAEETRHSEVKWHVAMMIPRLRLTAGELERAAAVLRGYLGDRSSIAKTCAIQALTDLWRGRTEMDGELVDLLEWACVHGTAAMKARGRKLLAEVRGGM